MRREMRRKRVEGGERVRRRSEGRGRGEGEMSE